MILQVGQKAADTVFSSKAGNRPASGDFYSKLAFAQKRMEFAAAKEAAKEEEQQTGTKEIPDEDLDFEEMISKQIDDLYEKIRKGEAVPSFQIGSASFTLKEWEKFLKQFDSLQDAIRQLIEEEKEKREEEKAKKQPIFPVS